MWHGIMFLTRWTFASKNFEAVGQAINKYHPPHWFTGALFIGVLTWQCLMVLCFAWAILALIQTGVLDRDRVQIAFMLSLGLLAAFVLADELWLEYDTEHAHILFFIAQLGP